MYIRKKIFWLLLFSNIFFITKAQFTINVEQPPALSTPEICVVTVDDVTGKNKIIWEHNPTEGIISYTIYKEVFTNIFDSIGNVPVGGLTEFIDINSSPASQSSVYKIASIDSCGVETVLSYYHKTIILTLGMVGPTISLDWGFYEDESNDFIPSQYLIYRGTDPDNFIKYDSVPGSQHYFNDENIFQIYYYKVGIEKPGGCSSGSKTNYTLSFSNKKDNAAFVGINTSSKLSDNIPIFPNPFTETTIIYIPVTSTLRQTQGSVTVCITDISGKIVLEKEDITGSTYELKRGTLKSGVYFIEITGDKISRGKLIVQ
ncbi:MAG: T9SS type A sorting domain-containing protein [Bacteroidia bacterium]|nr:T9SS type A sorting domain-containing protein [Bacteroidia bacterium]